MKYKYSHKGDEKSGTYIVSVYLSVIAVFFAIVDFTFNSRTGLHPGLISIRKNLYMVRDVWFIVTPVLSLISSIFSKKIRILHIVPLVSSIAWTVFCHRIDSTLNYLWIYIIPVIISIICFLLSYTPYIPSKWILSSVMILSSLSYIIYLVMKVPQLFYLLNFTNGGDTYISFLIISILTLVIPAVNIMGLKSDKIPIENTSGAEYDNMIADPDDIMTDSLKDESKLTDEDRETFVK